MTWGHRNRGGDSSGVARQLREVRKVCASDNAFAAVTVSGAVVTWGVKDEGGNYCSADELLESDVHDVHSTCNAFVAIKYDGSVVAWGGRRFGGHVPACAGLHICSGDEKRDRATAQQLFWQTFCLSSNWSWTLPPGSRCSRCTFHQMLTRYFCFSDTSLVYSQDSAGLDRVPIQGPETTLEHAVSPGPRKKEPEGNNQEVPSDPSLLDGQAAAQREGRQKRSTTSPNFTHCARTSQCL